MNERPFCFRELVQEIGQAGLQLTELGATEGSAGNISVFVRELDLIPPAFEPAEPQRLPAVVPALAGGWVLTSATGKRLRDLGRAPETTLCLIKIHQGGEQGSLYSTSVELSPTSEINSHLAIHNYHVGQRSLSYHAVVHAQSPYLVYLSHIPEYADSLTLNRHLLRWHPETLATFPEGIALIPFRVPGTPEQMQATLEAMREHRAAIWQHHGTVTRADMSVTRAADLVEYAEMAARYEFMNLLLGGRAEGLPEQAIHLLCERKRIKQNIF